jgi:hypothetical protein
VYCFPRLGSEPVDFVSIHKRPTARRKPAGVPKLVERPSRLFDIEQPLGHVQFRVHWLQVKECAPLRLCSVDTLDLLEMQADMCLGTSI